MEYLFVLCVGLIAGTLSGIVGFGSSIMLMPVLVIAFGPLQAVPIMVPLDAIIKGLITGSSLTAGSFIARRFVLRLDPERFRLLMDGPMLGSGIAILWSAAVPRQVAG